LIFDGCFMRLMVGHVLQGLYTLWKEFMHSSNRMIHYLLLLHNKDIHVGELHVRGEIERVNAGC
jgi:hypothetical protein